MNTPSPLPRQNTRWVAFVALASLFLVGSAFAQSSVNWNTSNVSGSGASGFWAGLTAIYAMVYSVFWVVAAIVLGFAAFKFKKGDSEAGLWAVGGGAFLGIIPFLVQFFRSLGGSGNILN